mgnify:CR=1 FL=1
MFSIIIPTHNWTSQIVGAYVIGGIFEELGYQLEPSELSAAFGLVQLKKLGNFKKYRQQIFKKHLNFLKKYHDYFDC